MNELNHYQIDYVPGKFELRLEDDYLQSIHFKIDPKMFKLMCITIVNQIVSYEEKYAEIDIANFPSPKAEVNTYDHKELKAYKFESTHDNFTLTLTYNNLILTEDLTIEVSPRQAKRLAIDCSNSIVLYEEKYGLIEL